jgi:hypothetical protein
LCRLTAPRTRFGDAIKQKSHCRGSFYLLQTPHTSKLDSAFAINKKEAVSKGKNSLFFVDFIHTPLREHFQIFNSPEDKLTFDTASFCV